MVFYYAWPAARDNLGTNCTLGVEHLDILCSICSIQIFHELKRLFPLQTRSYDYSLATLFPSIVFIAMSVPSNATLTHGPPLIISLKRNATRHTPFYLNSALANLAWRRSGASRVPHVRPCTPNPTYLNQSEQRPTAPISSIGHRPEK